MIFRTANKIDETTGTKLELRLNTIHLYNTKTFSVPSVFVLEKFDSVEYLGYDLFSTVSKGQFVGFDWNRIARLHSQVMTSTGETHQQHRAVTLKPIRMQPINLQSEYVNDETTTMILNVRRNEDSQKNPSPRWDLNPRPSVI